jgi:methionyl-tRNA synthetase
MPFYITTPIYYVKLGKSVFFQTGTDEHGQKVFDKATELGFHPQEYVDDLALRWKTFWAHNGIKPDNFIQTTDPKHVAFVREKLQDLWNRDLIYEGTYVGWYDKSEERFWTDKDIKDGLTPSGNPVERVEEKNYFFRMSHYQDLLLEHIESNPNFIRPEARKNKVLSHLSKPIGDLCISRPKSRLTWGIELPFDEDYVTYVWFDALLNYISSGEAWPADVHFIGKDILIFHAVYWPTMLMALGYDLPKQIFAHGWWLDVSGDKLGKSKGNAMDPYHLVETFGHESLRYLLLRETAFGSDGKFSEELFTIRHNNDLSNVIGNLINRVLVMTDRWCDGLVPPQGEIRQEDKSIILTTARASAEYHVHMDNFAFQKALESIQEIARESNKYIDTTEPWALKDDKQRLGTVLRNLLEAIVAIGKLLFPFMRQKATNLLSALGVKDLNKLIKTGYKIYAIDPLFPRI